MINHLHWDSDFFGYKIGKCYLEEKCSFEEILAEAIEQQYKLLYVKTSSEELALKLKNFLNEKRVWVDERVILKKSLTTKESLFTTNNHTIYSFTSAKPTAEMYKLALRSGEHSRFRLDENFRNQEFIRLYYEWIERSVNREIADEVLVCEKDDKIVGILTFKLHALQAWVGLVAVDNLFEGQKVGSSLFNKAFDVALQAKANEVCLVTQKANYKALYFYEKIGFQVCSLEYICHVWL